MRAVPVDSLENAESETGGCISGADECRYPGHRPKDTGSRTMPDTQSLPSPPTPTPSWSIGDLS